MASLEVPTGVEPDDPRFVENPVTGERFLFHTRPDDPATDPLAMDLWATPWMAPLAEHVHPRQDETFAVVEGTLEVTRDGVATTHEAGDEVRVEAGTPHAWSNAGDDGLHLTVRVEPGLRTEAFLRDLATLARRGAVGADGAPSMLRVAALYDAYGYGLLHLATPPLWVQQVLFGLLAPVASLLGKRADPVEGVGRSGL